MKILWYLPFVFLLCIVMGCGSSADTSLNSHSNKTARPDKAMSNNNPVPPPEHPGKQFGAKLPPLPPPPAQIYIPEGVPPPPPPPLGPPPAGAARPSRLPPGSSR